MPAVRYWLQGRTQGAGRRGEGEQGGSCVRACALGRWTRVGRPVEWAMSDRIQGTEGMQRIGA